VLSRCLNKWDWLLLLWTRLGGCSFTLLTYLCSGQDSSRWAHGLVESCAKLQPWSVCILLASQTIHGGLRVYSMIILFDNFPSERCIVLVALLPPFAVPA
jgi:hypothetical protein